MNNLEDDKILSKEIVEVIDMIISNNSNTVFGGSIALNAVGLLNRRISDIDIFILENSEFPSIIKELTEFVSDTVTNVNGKEVQRTGGKINNVKICIFKVNVEELQHSQFTFLGRRINIQNVNYAIQAKISYAGKRIIIENNKNCYNNSTNNPSKHEKDVNEIEENLKVFDELIDFDELLGDEPVRVYRTTDDDLPW
jgi:hypothetical protein